MTHRGKGNKITSTSRQSDTKSKSPLCCNEYTGHPWDPLLNSFQTIARGTPTICNEDPNERLSLLKQFSLKCFKHPSLWQRAADPTSGSQSHLCKLQIMDCVAGYLCSPPTTERQGAGESRSHVGGEHSFPKEGDKCSLSLYQWPSGYRYDHACDMQRQPLVTWLGG